MALHGRNRGGVLKAAQGKANHSGLFEERHLFQRWIMRGDNVARHGSPTLVVDWMADLVLLARKGVATETLREDKHTMLMRKAGQQV